jgi:hypothetical protein
MFCRRLIFQEAGHVEGNTEKQGEILKRFELQ